MKQVLQQQLSLSLFLLLFAFTASASPMCVRAIESLRLPKDTFHLKTGESFEWVTAGLKKSFSVNLLSSLKSVRKVHHVDAKTKFEEEINIDLPKEVPHEEVFFKVVSRSLDSSSHSPVELRSAQGTESFPASLHPSGSFKEVSVSQKQDLYQLTVEGRDASTVLRYEKTFSGNKVSEKVRTLKQLTIKSYLKGKRNFLHRLKTVFDINGIHPSEANFSEIVSVWLKKIRSPWSKSFELVPKGNKLSTRKSIDVYVKGKRVAFLSVDKKEFVPAGGKEVLISKSIEIEPFKGITREQSTLLFEFTENLVQYLRDVYGTGVKVSAGE